MTGDELKKYRFPETLTNQSRWFGLYLDELIPVRDLSRLGFLDQQVHIWYGCSGTGFLGYQETEKRAGQLLATRSDLLVSANVPS